MKILKTSLAFLLLVPLAACREGRVEASRSSAPAEPASIGASQEERRHVATPTPEELEQGNEVRQELREAASEAAGWMEDTIVSTRERLRDRWGEASAELQRLRTDLQNEDGETRTQIRQRIAELEAETRDLGVRLASFGEGAGQEIRNLVGRDDDTPAARENYGTPATPTPANTPTEEGGLMPTVTAPMPSPTLPDVPIAPVEPTATPIPTPVPEPTPLPELTPVPPTPTPQEDTPPEEMPPEELPPDEPITPEEPLP